MLKRPRRITVLLSKLRLGGAETQAVRLVEQLAERGWECRVLSLLPVEDYAEDLAAAGASVGCLGLRGFTNLPVALFNLAKDLKRYPPDVLLTLTFHANVFGKIVGRVVGVPTVVASIRSEIFGGFGRDLLEKWTEPLADCTVVNSQIVGGKLVDRGILKPDRFVVVPNAVVSQEVLNRTARDREDLVWLNVGRLVVAKGQKILLEAFSSVHRVNPNARLLIAGDGALAPDLTEAISALGLQESVTLLGNRWDVPELMAKADFYVSSSLWEGMPNAVLEAMATGLPFVATDVGGIRELLSDQAGNRLVPAGNRQALAEAMLSMMQQPGEELHAMSSENHAFIRAHHEPVVVTDHWEGLFVKLFDSRKKAQ
ncbi:MAG: glycosyltransferase [Gemmatimonadales bacterium]|nr:glycosyltransferase [Gemmatimonadales bacterium]